MENLYLQNYQSFALADLLSIKKTPKINYSIYQQSTNSLIVSTEEGQIYFLAYQPKTSSLAFKSKSGPVEDIVGKTIILFAYLVESESVLIITKQGDVMTIAEGQSEADIKAQNEEGIVGATLSPMQEYIYIGSKNRTLIQLDMQFDLVKEIPIDDQQQMTEDDSESEQEVRFTWRADGKFMVINFPTANNKGRKCLTRDYALTVFKSASQSDPQQIGLVQSVSEKGNPNLQKWVSWQPMGGMIGGSDIIRQKETNKERRRIILWEKNGLRHLEFQLPSQVKQILDTCWIQCRPSLHHQLFVVDTLNSNGQRELLFYNRANYHWYLKQTIGLSRKDKYVFIQGNRNTKLCLIRDSQSPQIQLVELRMKMSEQQWKTAEVQQASLQTLFYCVNGDKIHFTDFARGIIPPPMSQTCLKFDESVRYVVRMKQKPFVLVILSKQALLYEYDSKSGQISELRKIDLEFPGQTQWNNILFTDVKLLQTDPVRLKVDSVQFQQNNNKLKLSAHTEISEKREQEDSEDYVVKGYQNDEKVVFSAKLVDNALTITHNHTKNLVSESCTSFSFYHEFLIFTTLSNGMYEKMFIFNLLLDTWLYTGDETEEGIKDRIEKLEKDVTLNHRAIERGGIITSCTKGRTVLQLPRGNLETFSPKIISICLVKQNIDAGRYRQAFQLIRTHKLDLNLLCDVNLQKFHQNCADYMKDIQKVDYINLFVSQLNEQITSQLNYCYSKEKVEEVKSDFQINLKGNKIRTLCSQISKVLREVDKEKYILSIFTSQIKSGRVEDVLFEIKDMRQAQGEEENQNSANLPPHIEASEQEKKPKKKRNSQEILEYVCWLVDADAIYEASLLTYDLELASMTARCTQKDPKEYIPYLQSLKAIQSPIELRKKVCLDFKKYDKAVKELSKGNEQNVKEALELIKKHKLFKCGLETFGKAKNYERLVQVKQIVIGHLLDSGEANEAFNMSCSIHDFRKALDIGIQSMDGKKIKEVYHLVAQPPKISQIIDQIKEGVKNKGDLAVLYEMDSNYEEATRCYLRAGDYKATFQALLHLPKEYIFNEEIVDGFQLQYSLVRNQLIKQGSQVQQKFNRLQMVHKSKQKTGNFFFGKPRDSDDMYSQISVSSRSGSSYTVSTTTGMKKKKDKKRHILTRNVKQGSPLQEEYLVAFINDLKGKAEDNIKQAKVLIQHLIYLTLIEEATSLRDQARHYAEIMNSKMVKTASQLKFEEDHPEAKQIYDQENKKGPLTIDSFDYLL